MVTPFDKAGNVDYRGVSELVEWYWKEGIDGIFADCQSSEIFYLSLAERVLIAKTVIAKARKLAENDKKRKPLKILLSGHVSDAFEDQVKELLALAELKPDALILITNRMDIADTSDEQWVEDLKALASRLPKDMTLGLYECPKPYKRLLSETMLNACLQDPRFGFLKDTCCDAGVIKRRLSMLSGHDFGLYNANAQTLLETINDGADGYCGVMANFHPRLFEELIRSKNGKRRDELQAFLGTSAFIETLSYPSIAKWYLREFEGLHIADYSRSNQKSVTDYEKSCLRQMRLLSDGLESA